MRPPRLPRRLLAVAAAAAAVVVCAALVPAHPAAAADPRPAVLVSRIGSTRGGPARPTARRPGDAPGPERGRALRRVHHRQRPSTDDNGQGDVYLRDRRTGTTEAISVTPDGRAGNQVSFSPSISGDGRYVAFVSVASDLVAGDDGFSYDVFVRDRRTDTTRRVNLHPDGTRTGTSVHTQISANGRAVLWISYDGGLRPPAAGRARSSQIAAGGRGRRP